MQLLYKNSCLIKESEILQTARQLAPYLEFLREVQASGNYEALESFINLPNDQKLSRQVVQLVKKLFSKKLKYIIVVGIGGSNLGAKALYDALHGYFDLLEPDRFPKIIFVDTCDPEFLDKLQVFLTKKIKHPAEVLINIVSKSGTTVESAFNAEVILDSMSRFGKKALERVAITTEENSPLWKIGKQLGAELLAMPRSVGGRFSVFSAVGLFPLAVLGLDIKNLIGGATKAREICLNKDLINNPAIISASLVFLHYKNGRQINDNFFFHPELESLGKWYRQLIGESLGKEKNLDGQIVNAGIFPNVSIGSTDLHSVGQLYFGGPKNIFTNFVWSKETKKGAKLKARPIFEKLMLNLGGKESNQIMQAILQGVKIAYKKQSLPFTETVLDNLSPAELGAFMQYKMMEIIFLAKLINVNAFDEPSVEKYKTETRKILN